MFLFGFWGFVIGMVCGGLLNRRLLRDVPRDQWLKNRNVKMKYGALNWAFGLVGLMIGLYLARYS